MYQAGQSVPLIFNFHGYTSTAQEQEVYGDFRPIADTANFILIHPQGTNPGTGNFWNSFSTTAATNFDYQFIAQLIDSLSNEFSIDSSRIYSTGMSNGGFMSYDMACFMGNTFAAIASVTGSMIPSHLNACTTNRKIPIMQIHGTADMTVTYSGTGGLITSEPIDSLISFWISKNQCSLTPIETSLPDINTSDNCTAIHYVYENNGQNLVEFYKIINGGHTWPGSIFSSSGQNTNQDFSASREIWRFFSQHQLNMESLQTTEITINVSFGVFPNPTTEVVTIQLGASNEVSLMDINGKILTVFNESETISISNLQKGMYFLKDEKGITQKLIIQ
jgi:polyhydroxybutyrate depolymerase